MRICKKLLNKFDEYPLHMQIILIISLIRSKCIEDHILVTNLFDKIFQSKYLDHYIMTSLKNILYNHRQRVETFGRIPERNSILNRKTLLNEKIFMDAF